MPSGKHCRNTGLWIEAIVLKTTSIFNHLNGGEFYWTKSQQIYRESPRLCGQTLGLGLSFQATLPDWSIFLVISLLLLQTERSCRVGSQFQCHEKLNLHRNDTVEIVQAAFDWIVSCISNSHQLIFISSKAANSLLHGSFGINIGNISCCCGEPSGAEHKIYFRDKH